MAKQQESEAQSVKLEVRAYPIAEPKNNTLAFASVTINDLVAIHGIRVMDSEKGKFAAMPSMKGTDGNSVAVPCVAYILMGIAAAHRKEAL